MFGVRSSAGAHLPPPSRSSLLPRHPLREKRWWKSASLMSGGRFVTSSVEPPIASHARKRSPARSCGSGAR